MENVKDGDKVPVESITKAVEEQGALIANLIARVETLEKYHEGNIKEGWTEWAKRKYKEAFAKKEGEGQCPGQCPGQSSGQSSESWKEWAKRKCNETLNKISKK